MDENGRCPWCGQCRHPQPPATDLPHGATFAAAWAEWLGYRAKKRAKVTDVTAARQLKMLAALPEQQAVACLDLSITNGWTGLFPDKAKPGAKFKTRGEAEMDHFTSTVMGTLANRGMT